MNSTASDTANNTDHKLPTPPRMETADWPNALRQTTDQLTAFLQSQPPLAIALSGGVDSLTLAWVAHVATSGTCQMVHAVSPAVPPDATKLVKHYANAAGWNLTIINANEYNDPRYKRNPVNRCYYCKTNLYSRIQEVTGRRIASGTNTDDLGDYRPGLEAATQHGVVHPFVEVGINKNTIRQIASQCNLTEVAQLPAQPCLASRVETGIEINSDDLHFINNMERMLRAQLPVGDIRCRLTAKGVRIQIEARLLKMNNESLAVARRASIEQMIKIYCLQTHRVFIGISDYSRGSAFLHKPIIAIHTP